jgi:radical SAM protein with 4Fe4S-binding SPASM domain
MNEEQITVLSTAPQLGRVCLEAGFGEGTRIAIGHGGSARGKDIQIYTDYIGGCGTGRCYCSIQPNGLVTPCVFMPKVVGDLRKQTFMEIWEGSPDFQTLCDRENRTDHCRICRYKYQCGGCRARAYNYLGDMRAGDPGCIYNLKQWEQVKSENGFDPLTEVSELENEKV